MASFKLRSVEHSIMLYYSLYAFTIFVPTSEFSLKNCMIPGPFNYSGKLKVFCYKMGFRTVPQDLPDNVMNLVISFNYVSEIKVEDLHKLRFLTYLNASNNHISHIQEGAFNSSRGLKEINLSHNHLINVSGSWLQGLFKLSVLRLDGNFIEHIEPNAFVSLLSLRVLNLTDNKLQRIERLQLAFQLTTLQELYIGKNNFSSFQSSDLATSSASLKMLDLSHNPLRKFQITEDIFPVLECLDLSYCSHTRKLEWIVPDMRMLSSVTTLTLDGVRIPEEQRASIFRTFNTSLFSLRMNDIKPVNISGLFSDAFSSVLRVLQLGENNITSITEGMLMPCDQLQELDLSENIIDNISQNAFSNFTQLMSLQLQHNRLTGLNGIFKGLRMLKLLDLNGNQIKKLHCSDFASLKNLKKLYLYNNKIGSVNACLFKDLKHLEKLKLGTNRLLTVAKSFSGVLPNLKYLQLRYNKIGAIKKGTFAHMHSLLKLDLVDNQISQIDDYAFAELGNLVFLSLASNKITKDTIKSPNVFSGLLNLRELQIFSNYIMFERTYLDSPPFIHLKSLHTLQMNSQRHHGLQILPRNLLDGLRSLKVFYGGNLNIRYLHPDTFSFTPELWHVDLSKNVLSDNDALSPQVFHPVPNLTRLILSKSQLLFLDFLIQANLSKLSVLRANENQLTSVNQTVIQSIPRLKFLDLQNNSFPCDCSSASFINWSLQNNHTQVLYLNKYICNYPYAMRQKSLEDFNTESCMVDYDFIAFLCSSLIITFTLVVSFVYNFLRWHLVYTYYLFLALLHDRKRRKTTQQLLRFQYDAFVSYNSEDESWVMEELLPNLEGKQGWSLCLHHRDFLPGKSITDNIVDGIYSSRKTICLITRNYLRSNWCSQEIQVARFRLFDEKKDVLILIFLEDIPSHHLSPYYKIKKLVKKQTYLSWPKAGGDTRVFWQKVKMAMETKETLEEERHSVSGHDNGF